MKAFFPIAPIAFAVPVLLIIACSSSNTSTNNSSSSTNLCCQVNANAWDCPDQTSLEKCTSLSAPDPSGCTQRSSACGGASSTSTSSTSSTSSSSGSTTSSSGSTTSTSSSGGSGCNLFTCTNTPTDCAGIAPCMSTSTAGVNYCYSQAGNASECGSGTTPVTATVDGMQRTLCVPAGCPQPGTYVP